MNQVRAVATVTSLSLLSLTGCSEIFGPAERLSIQTDQDHYEAMPIGQERYAFSMVLRTENRGRRTVYLDRCGSAGRLIYGIAGESEPSAYNPVWACTGNNNPIRLRPGEFRVDTLQVNGPSGSTGHAGEPFGALEGRSQAWLRFRTCADVTRCAGSEETEGSNFFTVKISDSSPGRDTIGVNPKVSMNRNFKGPLRCGDKMGRGVWPCEVLRIRGWRGLL